MFLTPNGPGVLNRMCDTFDIVTVDIFRVDILTFRHYDFDIVTVDIVTCRCHRCGKSFIIVCHPKV